MDEPGPEGLASTALSPMVVTLSLTCDAEGRPIGSIDLGAGSSSAFEGWLSLMATLTRLLSERSGGHE